ncbi:prepilin-type N-terminal cleavage/methylation domain-containing protein [Bacillus infantis]|uniref:type II secretion system protein n=1 Tax=Bacillus infantis TaxID=324767 RepID=UPI00101CA8B2|nr:prepilin-type N-terminal cleavage/methylation domain-containing protein [Bacillus infantis]RYI31616.1 prepilin-type N-terminal cleavage/methylation domain-containing protein [Bacillus infantis]
MLKMLKNKLKDQRGLTLIELLAVIVILGIIAAIAIPSIGNIIENSKRDAIKADAIQLINAAKVYYAENGNDTDGKASLAELEAGYIDLVTEFTAGTEVNLSDFTITGSGTKDKISVSFNGSSVSAIDNSGKSGSVGSAGANEGDEDEDEDGTN